MDPVHIFSYTVAPLKMRLVGDNIYTDNQMPDYDFYSPNHAADAYELAAILCKEGFKNTSCINAMHITTMMVSRLRNRSRHHTLPKKGIQTSASIDVR